MEAQAYNPPSPTAQTGGPPGPGPNREPRRRSVERVQYEERGDDKKNSGCLFVGNIPFHYKEEDLAGIFGRIGPLDYVTIGIDKRTGNRKGHAFVQFLKPEDAQAAFDELKGYDIDGRQLRIDWDAGLGNKRPPPRASHNRYQHPYDRPPRGPYYSRRGRSPPRSRYGPPPGRPMHDRYYRSPPRRERSPGRYGPPMEREFIPRGRSPPLMHPGRSPPRYGRADIEYRRPQYDDRRVEMPIPPVEYQHHGRRSPGRGGYGGYRYEAPPR